MEHHLLQLSPPAQLMMSPSFFDMGGGGSGVFGADAIADPAAADDGGDSWVEDLMQLGELFGVGGGDDNAAVDGGAMGDDLQLLHGWQKCEGSASPDQPASCGDGDVSPPSGELACRDDDDNSATRKRRDRSKTIVSERKRRVRMKEKLYELRALVPNITKMDKASIIADAVVYVKDLQAHANKLREEVTELEARQPRSAPAPAAARRQQPDHSRALAPELRQEAGRRRHHHNHGGRAAADDKDEGNRSGDALTTPPHGARVKHVGAAQVGEGRFFVTVECERADGAAAVAAPLCAAVESLACFRVESSSLGCSPDRVVSTLILKVSEVGEAAMISECTVKLWVMAALLKEGFRPEATVEIS